MYVPKTSPHKVITAPVSLDVTFEIVRTPGGAVLGFIVDGLILKPGQVPTGWLEKLVILGYLPALPT